MTADLYLFEVVFPENTLERRAVSTTRQYLTGFDVKMVLGPLDLGFSHTRNEGTFLIDRTLEKTFLIDRTHYIETRQSVY